MSHASAMVVKRLLSTLFCFVVFTLFSSAKPTSMTRTHPWKPENRLAKAEFNRQPLHQSDGT